MKILTHPDNLELLKKELDVLPSPTNPFSAIQIVTDKYMDREKWTGRYVLPNGKAVEPKDVIVPAGRFAEWDSGDIWYLEKYGYIRKEMAPLFVQVNDSLLFRMANLPMIAPTPYLITSCF